MTIRLAQRGDREALAELTRAWWPQMRRWALLDLRDPVLAEDASQDALVRVVRHLHTFDPARPLGPWLRSIVRRCCTDARSARRRRSEVPERDDLAEVVRLDRQVDLSRSANRVLTLLGALTGRQREVLELVDLQGRSPTEAAADLGIAPGTARALLCEARRRLRGQLNTPELRALLKEGP